MDHQKIVYKNKSGKAETLRLKRQTFSVCTLKLQFQFPSAFFKRTDFAQLFYLI